LPQTVQPMTLQGSIEQETKKRSGWYAAERHARGAISSSAAPAAAFGPRASLQSGSAAAIVQAMSVAITVRDVPDEVRDELAARAARAGQSMQEYVRAMLVDATARPPVADVIARARARVEATGARADAESILAARDADRR
jgi:antitoxin FitA